MINDKNVIGLLEKAMQVEGLRQETLASNIANMGTNGYRRVDVNFEAELNKALNKTGDFDPKQIPSEIYQTKNTSINEFGNDVSLDKEVGEMVKNSLRHRAFMSLLKKKYQQIDSAIRVQ